jgi:hypothetical protein
MQNDVNGFGWGLLPGLIDDGVRALSMGINLHSGGRPADPPDAFQWEGPDGRSLLVWSGFTYPEGVFFFHEHEWRRGPVPRASDPWYHPPGPGDLWDPSPEGLRRAQAWCQQTLAKRLTHWRWPLVGVQVTNQWRMDNDPPDGLVPAFVAAWNAAGLLPRLRLSTMGQFLDRFMVVAGSALPRRRGDWQDWWVDGAAAFPVEQVAAGRAVARLARLPAAAAALGAPQPDGTASWLDGLRWHEHTFNAYDAISRPGSPLAIGHRAETASNAARLSAMVERQWCEVARSAPGYARSTRCAGLLVVNAERIAAGGWIDLPATALPVDATGVMLPDGRMLPFEGVRGPEWSTWRPQAEDTFQLPQDVWSQRTLMQRVYAPGLPPGATRCAFATAAAPVPVTATEVGSDAHWSWQWRDGRLVSLRHQSGGVELIDPAAPWPFAALCVDRVVGDARWSLLERRGAARTSLDRRIPSPCAWAAVPSHYGPSFCWQVEDQAWHRGEQHLRLLPDGVIELTTRLWIREGYEPQAWWLLLPTALRGRWLYDAAGHPTDAMADQLAGTCGDHLAPGRGLVQCDPRVHLAIDCRDTPVVSLRGPTVRDGRTAHDPLSSAAIALFCSYWITNFSTARPGLLETVHRLHVLSPAADPWPLLGATPWHLPAGPAGG